jgi:thiol-disulfide isomerase/thioredoxin
MSKYKNRIFMQKMILFLLFIRPCLLFSDNKHSYTITGTLPDSIDNVYVYLTPVNTFTDYTSENNRINPDSALVRKGRFVFNGIADTQKNLYSIRSEEYPIINGWVILEPDSITYNYQQDDAKEYAYARGSRLNDLLTDNILIPSIEIAKYGEALLNGKIDLNDPEKAGLINEMRDNTVRFRKNVLSFIHDNIHNPTGGYIFLMYSQMLQEKELNEILPNLPENVLRKYNERNGLVDNPKISVGSQYLPFSGMTPDGGYFTLSDIIKSKQLIVLDFWASWCVPCIKEIPVLTRLYEDYKDKGLEIIGISLDENETSWKKAIEKHNMSWIQIISNKGKAGNIAEMYGVYQIPRTVLINSKGEIVSDNLRGQELTEKINNLFK